MVRARTTAWTSSASPPDPQFGCRKCGHTEATVDRIAASGGGLGEPLDVQNRGFEAVSCTNCGYTELYRTGAGASDVVDLFLE